METTWKGFSDGIKNGKFWNWTKLVFTVVWQSELFSEIIVKTDFVKPCSTVTVTHTADFQPITGVNQTRRPNCHHVYPVTIMFLELVWSCWCHFQFRVWIFLLLFFYFSTYVLFMRFCAYKNFHLETNVVFVWYL